MHFFEHQERARRRTLALAGLFVLAVAAVVAAVDAAAVGILALGQAEFRPLLPYPGSGTTSNLPVLLGTSTLTLALIGAAAWWRAKRLRAGGAQVIRELGGIPIDSSAGDPRQRRLRNLVEEMALAAGAPIPEVFVLECEPGINAIAAGYGPADAALAVTRGALDKLDRDQLQGVIAHEFSHIVHGDTRIDIRLMAALFGILAIALLGRRLRNSGTGSRLANVRRPGALVLIGWVLNIIGSLGLFAGRLVKAALARQREYLADASAVQFTRNPQGIGGALRRIAVEPAGALLLVDTEEVSHMTFGEGTHARWLSAHPPLEERIRRIDPYFHPMQLVALAKRLGMDRSTAANVRDRTEPHGNQAIGTQVPSPVPAPLAPDAERSADPTDILTAIGNPGQAELITAALLTAGLPQGLQAAARSPQWAQALLCLLLLDADPEVRETQRLQVVRHLGSETERQLGHLLAEQPAASPRQRLPLAELAIAAVKHSGATELVRLEQAIAALIAADGRLSIFEYTLGRLLQVRVHDVMAPPRSEGRRELMELEAPARTLIRALARIGHRDAATRLAAETAGLARAGWTPTEDQNPDQGWREPLDRVLGPLDTLRPSAKGALIAALIATVAHDHLITTAEAESLRAICASLHVPLPLASSSHAVVPDLSSAV